MVIEAFKFFTNMKINNTESQVQKVKTSAKDPYLDRQPKSVPKPIQNLKRSSHVVQHETELLPKVKKNSRGDKACRRQKYKLRSCTIHI